MPFCLLGCLRAGQRRDWDGWAGGWRLGQWVDVGVCMCAPGYVCVCRRVMYVCVCMWRALGLLHDT